MICRVPIDQYPGFCHDQQSLVKVGMIGHLTKSVGELGKRWDDIRGG